MYEEKVNKEKKTLDQNLTFLSFLYQISLVPMMSSIVCHFSYADWIFSLM